MGGAYKLATDTKAPHVTQCVDPFHLVKLANDALDETRRQVWNRAVSRTLEHRRQRPALVASTPAGRCSKTRPTSPRASSRSSTSYAGVLRRSTAAGSSKEGRS